MKRENVLYVLICFFTLILLALTKKDIISDKIIDYINYILMIIFYFELIECVNYLIIKSFNGNSKLDRYIGKLFIPSIFFLIIGAFCIFMKEALDTGNFYIYMFFYNLISFWYILNIFTKYLPFISSKYKFYYKLFVASIIVFNALLIVGIYDYTVYATPEILQKSEGLFDESVLKGFIDCMGNGLKIIMGGLKNLECLFVLSCIAGGALIKEKLFDEKY